MGEPRMFSETHLVKSMYSRRIALFVDFLHAELPASVQAYEQGDAARLMQQPLPARVPAA
ncbi:hypothetical protein [Stenotrophomonas sp. SORGH_AS_0321]|uniref:hypothetical protein n=1 Tax=Stenotrophomonas sp. SORGH_AS_0321 TaxID=3041787 RepID=UPI00285DA418|nr:hypothetical protein [Stenotrophomonas sp. SORGH_AS_0321]MDR6094507.1 hypothetical protein [Stenotrophomonas sp. SORGH_AS_0321]